MSAHSGRDEMGPDEILVIFDSNQGSPYSKRSPLTRSAEVLNLNSDASPHSTRSDAEIIEYCEMLLPLEFERTRSMQSLRNRRDPHFHGNRGRRPRRVVDKSGEKNVSLLNIPEKSKRFLRDFVNTFIEEQWRCVIAIFTVSFFACWSFFAVLWYLVAYSHGDLSFDNKTGERLHEGTQTCLRGTNSFTDFFLLSMETQSSIGFGEKYPNDECPEAIFLMVAQIVTGIAIEGALIGIVYAKMVRPPRKPSDMKLSKKAVICLRDSKLCLLFRVSDATESHIVQSRVTAFWFEEKRSMEGEVTNAFQHQLKLENDGRVFVIYPLTVCHIIDRSSPLYTFSAKDLLEGKFEIVITFTGGSRTTGQLSQARTSYLPKEILWGHRFNEIVEYDYEDGTYVADYDRFDETRMIDTPLCSALEWDDIVDNANVTAQMELDPPSVNESIQWRHKMRDRSLARELEKRLSQISSEQKIAFESSV